MSRTVTALYDTKAEAEAARERLAREVDLEGRARIIDQNSVDGPEQQPQANFANVPLSGEDRATYREGLRRGGFMLCAEVDEDEDCDKIVSILDQTASVDLEDRQNAWRSEGWNPTDTSSAVGGLAERSHGMDDGARRRIVEEQRIPLVEEQLRVGKREIERGGARVRSYVEERPVEQTVTLREEHVQVERRPVDEPVRSEDLEKGGLLEERTIEMRETGEEPVIGKEARIREEVVMQKTASERTEQVRDTVRRTEADVNDQRSGDGAEDDGA